MVTRIQMVFQLPLATTALMFLLSIILSNHNPSNNVGNEQTCQLQGFLVQFGLQGGVCCDVWLSLTYLLMIKFQWQDKQVQKLEKWVHLISWPLVIGPAIYLLKTRSFQSNPTVCWIKECDKFDPICAQENATALYIRAASSIVAFFHLFFSCYVVVVVYKFAQKAGHSQSAYMMARRGLFYAGTIVILQVPYFIATCLQIIYDARSLQSLCASTFALGGFLNMMVFLMFRRKMRTSYGKVFRIAIDRLTCYVPKEEPRRVEVGRDLFRTTAVDAEDKDIEDEIESPDETSANT